MKRRKRRVENSPTQPRVDLLLTDGRPWHLTKPRPQIVAKIYGAMVAELEGGDILSGTTWPANIFLVVTILREIRETGLEDAPERGQQFAGLVWALWRGPLTDPSGKLELVYTEEHLRKRVRRVVTR